jgi:hypothetical protein
MRQIPLAGGGSVFDRGLSRPIDFCVAPDDAPAAFYSTVPALPLMFRMGPLEGCPGRGYC